MSGKGSAPRNCFSPQFKANYEAINWGVRNAPRSVRKPRGPRKGHWFYYNEGGMAAECKRIWTSESEPGYDPSKAPTPTTLQRPSRGKRNDHL